MAKNPDTPKKPAKAPKSKAPNSKASRPDVQPIGPALAELLNPAINRGESGIGSGTGLQPPPDNSWDRRSGGEAAAHRARASTKGTSEMSRSAMRQVASVDAPSQPSPASGRGLARVESEQGQRSSSRGFTTCAPSPAAGSEASEAARGQGGGASASPASTKPRSANSRRPITAPRPRFRRSIRNWQNNSASPPRRKTPPRWRGRRATRWRRSASPPPPTRWRA